MSTSNLGEGSGLLIREAWFESKVDSQIYIEDCMSAKKESKRDPMKTKTGKTRLGPLNVEQLTKMLETCRPKHRGKIQRAIDSRSK